jgi:predicted O-methyltransferase YrrM
MRYTVAWNDFFQVREVQSMKRITVLLCVIAIGIAITTITAAWLIQAYAPGQIRFGIISLWVGRAIWIAVAATCVAGLIIVFAGSSQLSGRRIFFISMLTAVVLVVSCFVLDFNAKVPVGKISGQYIYTADWTTEHVATWTKVLAHLKDKPNVRALEIGSYEGRSAIWFLENILTHSSSAISCIDIFDRDYEINFDYNMQHFAGKVKKIRAPSQLALRGLEPATYDFAYIDGSHTSKDTLIDAVLAWDLMKPGGVIIIDDYLWENGKEALNNDAFTPQLGINAFLNVFEPYLDVVDRGSQIIVRKRLNINKNSPQLISKSPKL